MSEQGDGMRSVAGAGPEMDSITGLVTGRTNDPHTARLAMEGAARPAIRSVRLSNTGGRFPALPSIADARDGNPVMPEHSSSSSANPQAHVLIGDGPSFTEDDPTRVRRKSRRSSVSGVAAGIAADSLPSITAHRASGSRIFNGQALDTLGSTTISPGLASVGMVNVGLTSPLGAFPRNGSTGSSNDQAVLTAPDGRTAHRVRSGLPGEMGGRRRSSLKAVALPQDPLEESANPQQSLPGSVDDGSAPVRRLSTNMGGRRRSSNGGILKTSLSPVPTIDNMPVEPPAEDTAVTTTGRTGKSARFRPKPLSVADSNLQDGGKGERKSSGTDDVTALGQPFSGVRTGHSIRRDSQKTEVSPGGTEHRFSFTAGAVNTVHATVAPPGALLSPKNKAFLPPTTPKTPNAVNRTFADWEEEGDDRQNPVKHFSSQAGEVIQTCWSEISFTDLAARAIDSKAFNVFLLFLTLFALLSDDIRLASTTRETDNYFFAFSVLVLVCYLFEFIVSCVVRDRYRWNFYFWLELFALVSLISDIGWIWQPALDSIINNSATLSRSVIRLADSELSGFSGLSTVMTNCGLGSGAVCIRGHTATAFLIVAERICRLFRYVRVVKLYKALKKGCVSMSVRCGPMLTLCFCCRSKKSATPQHSSVISPLAQAAQTFSGLFALGGASGFDTATASLVEATEPLNNRNRRPSFMPSAETNLQHFKSAGDGVLMTHAGGTLKPIQRVGTKLSDLTTRRVVLLILFLVFMSPLLDETTASLDTVGDSPYKLLQLWLLHRRPQDLNVTQEEYKFEVQSFALNTGRVAMLDVCSTVGLVGASGCANPPSALIVNSWLTELLTSPQYDVVDDTGDVTSSANISYAPILAEDHFGTAISQWSADDLTSSRAEVVSTLRPTEYEYFEADGCYNGAAGHMSRRLGDDLLSHPFISPSAARKLAASTPTSSSCLSYVVFSTKYDARRRASFALGRTLLVIFIVGVAVAIFTRDAQALVVRHIERMVQMMRALRRNPLQPLDKLYAQLKEAEGGPKRRPSGNQATPLSPRSNAGTPGGPGNAIPGSITNGITPSGPADTGTARAPAVEEKGGRPIAKIYSHASTSFRVMTHQASNFIRRIRGQADGEVPTTAPPIPEERSVSSKTNIGTFYGRRSLHKYGVGDAGTGTGVGKDDVADFSKASASGAGVFGEGTLATAMDGPSHRSIIARQRFKAATTAAILGAAALKKPPPPKSCLPVRNCWNATWNKAFKPFIRCCGRKVSSWVCTSHDDADSYETLLLENTIIKVGGLLQIGFGEAGRDIIAKNMQGHGVLKPLVNGQRVDAVFGFCDVRQFTDVTECLQEEVMVFVNKIGQIVHSATHRLNGAPNKNIGDAFLLVWKLPPIPRRPVADFRTRGSHRNILRNMPKKGDENGQMMTKRGSFLRAFGFPGSFKANNLIAPAPGGGMHASPETTARSMGAVGVAATPVRASSAAPVLSDEGNMLRTASRDKIKMWTPSFLRAKGSSSSMPPFQRTPSFVPEQVANALPVSSRVDAQGVIHHRNTSAPSNLLASVVEAVAESALDQSDLPSPPASPQPTSSARGRTQGLSGSRRASGPPILLHADMTSSVRFPGNPELSSSIPLVPAPDASPQISVVVHVGEPADENATGLNKDMASVTSISSVDGRHSSAETPTLMHGRASSFARAPGNVLNLADGPFNLPRTPIGRPAVGSVNSMNSITSVLNTARHARRSTVVNNIGPQGRRPSMSAFRKEDVERRADQALAAFLKIIIDINRANTNPKDDATNLRSYQLHQKIALRFNRSYSVKMGFGLHIGWAIEGAIGSKFKVDASYLSPHVNMAARLEGATKQFGVPLLISHDFATQLSEPARGMLRLVDCVTVKGSQDPMKLYTFDIFTMPDDFGEDVAINWDKGNAKSLAANSKGVEGMASSLIFNDRDEFSANETAAEGSEMEGPPQDFKIKIDFATDPAVNILQTIRRGCVGWNFPDEDTALANYRARRGYTRKNSDRTVSSVPDTESVYTLAGPSVLSPMNSARGGGPVTPSGMRSPMKSTKSRGGRFKGEMASFEANLVEEEGEFDEDLPTSPGDTDRSSGDLHEIDESEKEMCRIMVDQFFEKFNEGVLSYILGDWQAARGILKEVLALKYDDGPSQTLLRVMDDLCVGGPGGPAPPTWQCFRELTEK